MRNRDVVGYMKVHGLPVVSTKELQVRIEAATARQSVEEEAYWRERADQLEAAKRMLQAQEAHQIAEVRTTYLRNRRKPT